MPWYLHNGDGSSISMNSLKSKGGREIWARLRPFDAPTIYDRPDGSRDRDAFQRDRWAHETLHFVRKRKTLVHCLPIGDGAILSDHVKAVIDRLDPHIHNPWQVRVFTHDGQPYPWTFWYYQHEKLPRVEAIDIDKSRLTFLDKPYSGYIFESPIVWSAIKPRTDYYTYLDARTISGHHFFREARTGYKWCFFSDDLYDALQSEHLMDGFRLEYVGLTHAEYVEGTAL